ncbi:MAG: hypothetical protein ACYC4S_14220 [Rhodoferax sp.]
MTQDYTDNALSSDLVRVALEWENKFGVAPQGVTGGVAEFDAAMLTGHSPESYSLEMQGATAVRKGFDFRYSGQRYQVEGNRPSGKPGSFVSRTGKPGHQDWDFFTWVLYDESYTIQEAWRWDVDAFGAALAPLMRLGPRDLRRGVRLA